VTGAGISVTDLVGLDIERVSSALTASPTFFVPLRHYSLGHVSPELRHDYIPIVLHLSMGSNSEHLKTSALGEG